MKFSAAQIDSLAAEYVLGTLHGAARQRFEQLLAERGDVRQSVWRWERHLNQIGQCVKPNPPPGRVWRRIRDRIENGKPKPQIDSWWRSAWLALPAAAAAAWLAVVLLPAAAPLQVAVFADQNADPLWIVSANVKQGFIRTEAISAVVLSAENSHELWVLQPDGPPLSLGLLPNFPDTTDTRIPQQIATVLAAGGRLAISIEPAGGSPTGLPTGPVVYQASLLKI